MKYRLAERSIYMGWRIASESSGILSFEDVVSQPRNNSKNKTHL